MSDIRNDDNKTYDDIMFEVKQYITNDKDIEAIKKESPDCKVMVGGAVLTESYAKKIGADFYSKDAMQSVEAARKVLG